MNQSHPFSLLTKWSLKRCMLGGFSFFSAIRRVRPRSGLTYLIERYQIYGGPSGVRASAKWNVFLNYVVPSWQKERSTKTRHQSSPGPDCFPLHQTNGPSGKSKLPRRNSLMESGPRGPLK